MSRGTTIADFVQAVFYAIYKVRLDFTYSAPNSDNLFHANTDKFKEVVMEANFVLQELQQQMDWNWLRSRLTLGTAEVLADGAISEFHLPDHVYKVCTGFNDAVRLHNPHNSNQFIEIPFTSPRNGTVNTIAMVSNDGRLNVPDTRLVAFVVGDHLTFNRPFTQSEAGMTIETDVVDLLEPLHICSSTCTQPCPYSYVDKVFTKISDPYYMVVRTALKRAEGDPSAADRVLSLGDEAMKLLSAMRENDSAKTVPDTYTTYELGFTRIL
jgi:hypothetical protein